MGQSATEDMLSFALIVGNFPITDFGPGGAIRFVAGAPKYTMRIGVAGLGSFTRVNDNSGTMSTDLLPTGDSNDALNAMLKFSESRVNGANFAVSLIDTSGRFSLVCASCAIMKNPDPTIGDGSGLMTWDLIGVDWVHNTGGRGATPVFSQGEVPELSNIPGFDT